VSSDAYCAFSHRNKSGIFPVTVQIGRAIRPTARMHHNKSYRAPSTAHTEEHTRPKSCILATPSQPSFYRNKPLMSSSPSHFSSPSWQLRRRPHSQPQGPTISNPTRPMNHTFFTASHRLLTGFRRHRHISIQTNALRNTFVAFVPE
jgi:hypothetical protein